MNGKLELVDLKRKLTGREILSITMKNLATNSTWHPKNFKDSIVFWGPNLTKLKLGKKKLPTEMLNFPNTKILKMNSSTTRARSTTLKSKMTGLMASSSPGKDKSRSGREGILNSSRISTKLPLFSRTRKIWKIKSAVKFDKYNNSNTRSISWRTISTEVVGPRIKWRRQKGITLNWQNKLKDSTASSKIKPDN